MAPLFSIITVTYNASATLPTTLRSIKSQTCNLYEYIIQDGASQDQTIKLAESANIPNIRIYTEKDNGLYDAMNKALSVAKGDYVIFLNAGDKFHSEDTLQIIADKIMNNDYPGIIYGQTDIVDLNGNKLGNRHLLAPESLTLDSFANGMVVCHQAFIALRRITGYYNLKYRFSADYDWCIRCLQHSRSNIYANTVLIDYLNEGVTTSNRYASLLERFKIMCHYYGTTATLLNHIKFIPRFIKRRYKEKNYKNNI
jgi:glycosyltransferase involved in cell wall biosynthesis